MSGDELYEKIQLLWDAAGQPSCRSLRAKLGGVPSHTTISETLNGTRVPSKDKLRLIIRALGGDWEEFEPLYPQKTVLRRMILREAPRDDTQQLILEELRAIRALLKSAANAGL